LAEIVYATQEGKIIFGQRAASKFVHRLANCTFSRTTMRAMFVTTARMRVCEYIRKKFLLQNGVCAHSSRSKEKSSVHVLKGTAKLLKQ